MYKVQSRLLLLKRYHLNRGETAVAVLWRRQCVSFRRNIEKVWRNDLLPSIFKKMKIKRSEKIVLEKRRVRLCIRALPLKDGDSRLRLWDYTAPFRFDKAMLVVLAYVRILVLLSTYPCNEEQAVVTTMEAEEERRDEYEGRQAA
ncbi:hypothetical protein BK133_15690 [Paenibacillus sp. FSL H8-0548]|uniref:hypothetical protein n=1 Tax=Paenibacillus sp. FSL H8-0548 TaxID=1920422 RepID=UPI00096E5945|nr:hypothetical protein [Paenibacillus sp. FSL H8-0548]OMF31672.1 hypothetical protein BK133_15690 [Paenibacillus sp. FSL H8-0548]